MREEFKDNLSLLSQSAQHISAGISCRRVCWSVCSSIRPSVKKLLAR